MKKEILICSECKTIMNTKDNFYFACPKCCCVLDFRKKFVLFDQLYHTEALFSIKQHDILRNEIISTILQHKGTLLYIKPHPRQEIVPLRDKIQKYGNRVSIKTDFALVLSNFCIPILLGASSACLDCLKMGKPCIEYVRDECKDVTVVDGVPKQYNYEYQKLKLVFVIHNPDELIDGVKRIYNFNLEG